MAVSNGKMLAVEVGHQVDLIRLGSTLGADVNPYLTSISKKVREILLRTEYIDTIKLKNEVIKEVSAEMNAELGDYIDGLEGDLKPLISEEVAYQYSVIKEVVGKGVAVSRPTVKATTALINQKPMVLNGKALSVSERLGNYTPNQIKAVKDVITAGWSDGLTTRQIAQNITGTKQIKGVIQTSQSSAYAMAKDLTSHISSQSKAKVGQDNNDLIIGEKVVVTLDSRTSPICQDYGSQDGGGKEYFYKSDGKNFPRPPFHYNCRSSNRYILAPEYEEISNEGQTRNAVVDGKAIKVDADKNWMDLAKEYPSLARQSLGKQRAEVLDAMSASEFTKVAYNRMGQSITLDQMKESNDRALKVLSS